MIIWWHEYAVSKSGAVEKCRPTAVNTTLCKPVCPTKTINAFLLATSHARTVLFALPEITHVLLGEKATLVTQLVRPAKR